MVKPTLKPESEKEKKEDDLKDDKLKEWGILPLAVVIDESEKEKDKKDAEAAIAEFDNLETDVDGGSRPMIVKCCACFAVFAILLIVTCTIGSFLYFHYGNNDHKWNGWCSVKYGDDNDSGEKQGHHGDRSHGSGSQERHHNRPYGNDALYPRPTGPPGGRTCNQQSQVDIDSQLERVDRPQEEDCERLTILHDYNVNISAYRLWKSEICYITWIEEDVLMNPEEFWTNMQDPGYLNQWFDEFTISYRAVLPVIPTPLHEQEDGKFGEYLDGPKEFLCEGAETYWIEKIPDEELAEFLELVDQIMQELMALAAAYDTDMEDGNHQRPQHHGMPFPGGDGGQEGMPWEDFMPLGNPRDDLPMMDDRDDWPGHHGMRDEDREYREGHHSRQRRGAHHKLMEKAADAKKCADLIKTDITEIGKDLVLHIKTAPECVMKHGKMLDWMAKKTARK